MAAAVFFFLFFFFDICKSNGELHNFNGTGFNVFHIKKDMNHRHQHMLISPPEHWITTYSASLTHLDKLIETDHTESMDIKTRAQNVYLDMLKGIVLGTAFGKSERSVGPALGTKPRFMPFNENVRKQGADWVYLGLTMVGEKRLDTIKDLLLDVFRKNVTGDYMETGVWRGGASIFARGIIKANHQSHRLSFVCDSFSGLPPGDLNLDAKDKGYDFSPYLEVSDNLVAGSFYRLGVLDQHVWFVKGFFNDTMPPLAPHVSELAILRLDGDMYESTVDVLYHMYTKIQAGGYVIVDDWIDLNGADFPAKTACEDFFAIHNLAPQIVVTDISSVYWQVTAKLDKVEYWRYTSKRFKAHHTKPV